MTEPHPLNKGELEYGSILPNGEDWRLYKFDAGMGETEYRIFRNEKFFAMFDNRQDADLVMVTMTCSTTSAKKVLDDFDLINILKKRYRKRYRKEMSVIDVLENVEDEILALRQQEREQKNPSETALSTARSAARAAARSAESAKSSSKQKMHKFLVQRFEAKAELRQGAQR